MESAAAQPIGKPVCDTELCSSRLKQSVVFTALANVLRSSVCEVASHNAMHRLVVEPHIVDAAVKHTICNGTHAFPTATVVQQVVEKCRTVTV